MVRPPKSKTPEEYWSTASTDPSNIFLQYHFVEMLTEHLSECSKTFEGDLTEMLVLALIGQVQLKELIDATKPVNLNAVESEGISSSRISDVTGLPRQTVRRKLSKMQEKGWIAQGKDHRWRLVFRDGQAVAAEALAGLFERGLDRVKRLNAKINPYLQ